MKTATITITPLVLNTFPDIAERMSVKVTKLMQPFKYQKTEIKGNDYIFTFI